MSDSVSTGATGITMVCCLFRDTPAGRAVIQYAADLAARLHVLLDVRYVVPQHGNDSVENQRVRAAVQALVGGGSVEVSFVHDGTPIPFHPGAVVVNHEMVRQRRSTWTVAPQGETGVLVRGAGPVCIPLGDGESGSWASLLGIPIARALGLSVVFYHTTWRNPAVASDEARAHMDPDAQLVLATAHQRAVAAGVAYHTIVEMADGVAEGIVRAALRERCSLIITARGRATGRGSYVDQLLAESPIPVWSAPRKETP